MKAFHCTVLFACLIALMIPWPAVAWDAQAHELIATMAFAQLNPKAQQAVTALAQELQNPEQAYDAVTIACWMDDLRRGPDIPYHGTFLSWHYIDIGLDREDPQPSLEPGDDNEMHGNVVQALKRAVVVLKGGTDPYVTTKAMACAMVMHLVGDIHQPLHCATKYFVSGGRLRNDAGATRKTWSTARPATRNLTCTLFGTRPGALPSTIPAAASSSIRIFQNEACTIRKVSGRSRKYSLVNLRRPARISSPTSMRGRGRATGSRAISSIPN